MTNGGDVFFASDRNNPHIQQLDGQPHSVSKELSLYSVNGKLGLYDENFKLRMSFDSIDDFLYDYEQDPSFVTPYKVRL